MEIKSKTPSYYGKFRGQGMVTLSYDDGREDNYRVALPIMEKYGILSTLHVATGYIDGTEQPPPTVFGTMTIEQCQEWHRMGHEISSHSDKHLNERTDFATSIRKLKEWGVTRNGIVDGFASPGSGLTMQAYPEMKEWFIENGLTHARSGDDPNSTGKYDIVNNMDYPPIRNYRLTSIVVKDNTELSSLIPAIYDAMVNKRWCIIMLHSIASPGEPAYGADGWYWDKQKFEKLCQYLASIPDKDLLKVTMRDGYYYANSKHKESYSSGRRGAHSSINNRRDISNTIQQTKVINTKS